MAKLIVMLNSTMVGNHFIDTGRVTIGRRSGNDVQLDDPGVSKEHAVIQTVGNDHIFEDLGSTNGSTMNGARITKHILQNGDVIAIGAHQVRYANIKANPEMDYDRTMMIRTADRDIGAMPLSSRTDGHVSVSVSTARSSLRAGFPLGEVTGIKCAFAGQKIELERPLKTFGTVGEQVAVIVRRPPGYFITHVEGNKTARVNGQAIGSESRALQDGDVIEVGREKFEFSLK
jgi:pSer/pThr/pTyr-binding forkhead associated (FHA) protein